MLYSWAIKKCKHVLLPHRSYLEEVLIPSCLPCLQILSTFPHREAGSIPWILLFYCILERAAVCDQKCASFSRSCLWAFHGIQPTFVTSLRQVVETVLLTPGTAFEPFVLSLLRARQVQWLLQPFHAVISQVPTAGLGKGPVRLSLDGRGRAVPCACDHWVLEAVSWLQLMFLMEGRSQEDAGIHVVKSTFHSIFLV